MDDQKISSLSYSARQAIQRNVDTKSMQTLLGICTGIIADDIICDKEIAYLKTWLSDHADICRYWPASTIHLKINTILQDGKIDSAERASLLSTLKAITGNSFVETGSAAPTGPALPIDDDPSVFLTT